MPLPIIIPLTAAAAKVAAGSAILETIGAGVSVTLEVIGGAGVVYTAHHWFFKSKKPVVEPIKASETSLHATSEKIDSSIKEVTQLKSELITLDAQATDELAKAKTAYAELEDLYKKLKSGLTDPKEIEAVTNQILKIISNDSKLLEELIQIIKTIKKDLTPTKRDSFFKSAEFVQYQSLMKAMVEKFNGGTDSLEAISHGFNRS